MHRVKHDGNHQSNDLIHSSPTSSSTLIRKWRTGSGGEGQASVVLQLEKAEQIHSIDIGNEGSTFVEVLVGDSDAEVKIDYQVLLGASAFMTPAEAKAWTNVNKVRMFGPAALNKTTREKKW